MEDLLNHANQIRIDATYSGRAHYKASDFAFNKKYVIGVPTVISSSIVATSIFSSLTTQPGIFQQVVTGFLSMVTAILSALQTFYNFSDTAEKHRVAGAKYSILRRDLDMYLLKYNNGLGSIEDALAELKALSDRLSLLGLESPSIPDRAFDKAVKELSLKGSNPTSVGTNIVK